MQRVAQVPPPDRLQKAPQKKHQRLNQLLRPFAQVPQRTPPIRRRQGPQETIRLPKHREKGLMLMQFADWRSWKLQGQVSLM